MSSARCKQSTIRRLLPTGNERKKYAFCLYITLRLKANQCFYLQTYSSALSNGMAQNGETVTHHRCVRISWQVLIVTVIVFTGVLNVFMTVVIIG